MQEPVDNKVPLLGGSRKYWYLSITLQWKVLHSYFYGPRPNPPLPRGVC